MTNLVVLYLILKLFLVLNKLKDKRSDKNWTLSCGLVRGKNATRGLVRGKNAKITICPPKTVQDNNSCVVFDFKTVFGTELIGGQGTGQNTRGIDKYQRNHVEKLQSSYEQKSSLSRYCILSMYFEPKSSFEPILYIKYVLDCRKFSLPTPHDSF
jgi:hypothetical protein